MNRIKQLRQQKDIKQEELARLLNVQRSAVSKYETGKVPLTDDTLGKLSEIFNVSIDYILYKTDNPTPLNKKEEEPEEAKKVKWGEFGVSFGSGRDLNSLSDEEKDEITELLNFAIQQRIEKKKKKAEEDKEVGKSGDGKK